MATEMPTWAEEDASGSPAKRRAASVREGSLIFMVSRGWVGVKRETPRHRDAFNEHRSVRHRNRPSIYNRDGGENVRIQPAQNRAGKEDGIDLETRKPKSGGKIYGSGRHESRKTNPNFDGVKPEREGTVKPTLSLALPPFVASWLPNSNF